MTYLDQPSEDLALAAAVALGEASAVRQLEAQHGRLLRRLARRYAGPQASEDDLLQHLRERLLCARGDRPPRIAEFDGRGTLRGWLRVAATRTLTDWLRRDGRHEVVQATEAQHLDRIADGALSPELAALHRQGRDAFTHAFREAVAALPREDRAVLRLVHGSGRSVHAVGRLLGVHGATITRRLQKVRGRLERDTRTALSRRLALRGPELDALIAGLMGSFDASLSALLATVGSEPLETSWART